MVLAEPLIERMKEKEKDVKVIKVTKLDLSEVSPCLPDHITAPLSHHIVPTYHHPTISYSDHHFISSTLLVAL